MYLCMKALINVCTQERHKDEEKMGMHVLSVYIPRVGVKLQFRHGCGSCVLMMCVYRLSLHTFSPLSTGLPNLFRLMDLSTFEHLP